MAGAEYWIWLQKTLGFASPLACKLVAQFGDPEKLYCAGREAWLASGLMTEKQCDKLCRHSPSESFSVMMDCLKYDLDVVTPDSPHYPQNLLHIPDYPMVLYVSGNKTALNAPVLVSVVGTRKASVGGDRFARQLCKDFAESKIVVASGGALGIDTAAHEGALSADGVTVVVLGCGIGYEYLMQNEPMRRKAAEKGAVISEFFPGTPPTKSSFPTRNRILAGMAQATIVVEAAEKSGSFITAGDAFHMNRMVFAVPAAASGSFYSGTDRLIREKKALPAENAATVVRMLQMQYTDDWSQGYEAVLHPEPPGKPIAGYEEFLHGKKDEATKEQASPAKAVVEKKTPPKKRNTKKKKDTPPPANGRSVPADLEGDVLAVWNALAEGPKSPDGLVETTGLSARQVMISISKLEFKGLAVKEFGKVTLK
ncbi:MAG: DNA-protecting protein DprA [Ruminococcaceae bacterium]|nr:DNA-protecting protein DprA [Oscillospiraceae bacterium]